jgi:hypothetical protein
MKSKSGKPKSTAPKNQPFDSKTSRNQVSQAAALQTRQPPPKQPAKKRTLPVNLYWVMTSDHSEDWFIFARSAKAAKRLHEDYEGYDAGDARTRTVVCNVQLKRYEGGRPTCHAQIEDLVQLGFEIVDGPEYQRSVRYRGRLYSEGCMELLVRERTDDMMETLGKGRPNRTKPTSIQ